ncbi:hypothetical protein TSMEX_001416 [Taenia solium]
MRLWASVPLFLLVASAYAFPRGSRALVRSPLGGYGTSLSGAKTSSGLSNGRKLLLAAGGMAAVYAGFKLASSRDISRYTVCEGRRVEVDSSGVAREYMYTVCPSHLRYCCRNELYGGEVCCSGNSYYSQPWGLIIGSLVGTLLILVGIGLLAYFCCRRRRGKQSQSAADDVPSPSPPPPNFVTIGGRAPAFDSRVSAYPDQPPPYPSSVPPSMQAPPYPGVMLSDPNPPYPASSNPALGSGWGAVPPPPSASYRP